ncbi:hypothetical protein DF156_14680 [Burkholderia ubonensis]|nr:hypothetical protein DF155_13020 [Burkholderia ubonensis]RQP41297.1 hypothetical protein DF156_14680 [Burkholderia ubonensis]RQP44942.1 hypothetical protein DF154_04350 [Burkholderia ubonensis]RQP60636.1 hypothetical protein DF151_13795 [Burkholderia ubonensis]RQP61028.1 hypothetical protein DF144_02185 [Burkholderia ubonensis]
MHRAAAGGACVNRAGAAAARAANRALRRRATVRPAVRAVRRVGRAESHYVVGACGKLSAMASRRRRNMEKSA